MGMANRLDEFHPIPLIAHSPECKTVANGKLVHHRNAISDALNNCVSRGSHLCGERSQSCLNVGHVSQQQNQQAEGLDAENNWIFTINSVG